MASDRITFRVDETIHERLQTAAQAAGKSESEMVREALEDYLLRQGAVKTCYDMAKKAGVIGCVKGGPSDLSTNSKYMGGFARE